jgi:arabinogalactan oligomer/maltooligosaccharide transport system substrate-binding protein
VKGGKSFMKKWLVLLIALVMVFTAAAGVSANTSSIPAGITPEKGAKLIVWESEDQYKYMSTIAQAFSRAYKIPVTVQKVEITDQISKMTLAKKGASNSPDVVVFPHDRLGEAVKAKLVYQNSELAALTKKNAPASAIDAVSMNGVLYGYPKQVESVALIYNKKLVPTPPKTWDDVIKLSKNKNLHNPANKRYVILWEVGGAYHSYAFIGSQGGYVFGKKGSNKNDVGIASAGAVKSLSTYAQVRKALYPSTLKSGSITGDVVNGLFQTGKVAMTINGPWMIDAYQKAGINVGVTKIPAFGTSPAKPFGGVRAYYVSSKAMYPEAAKLFAHYATQKYAQTELYTQKKSIPANKDAANSVTVKKDAVISGFSAQFADATPMPSIPEMGNYWGNAGTALTEIFDKGVAPKAAADKAKKAMDAAIKGSK